MAITWVHEVYENQSGHADVEGVRSYERTFQVLSDSKDDGPKTIGEAWTLPRLLDVYADRNGNLDTGARCKDIKVEREDGHPTLWKVTCSYDTKPREQKEKDKQEQTNPLNRPARIQFSSNGRKLALAEDVNKDPVLNSAGDPYDPPIESTEYNLVVEVEKNLPVFASTVIFRFVGAVNAGAFLGFPANVVLCKDITASSQEENGIFFWQTKIVFEITKDQKVGWKTLVLDQGVNEFPEGGTVKEPIRLGKPAQAVTKPVPLNGDGEYLDLSDPATKPVYLEFQVYPLEDFSGLALFA